MTNKIFLEKKVRYKITNYSTVYYIKCKIQVY